VDFRSAVLDGIDRGSIGDHLPMGGRGHRDIEGGKNYRLYTLDGAAQVIQPADVAALVELGLISSNKKFPSATYWLTPQGQQCVIGLT
jgi:hypothetical protein